MPRTLRLHLLPKLVEPEEFDGGIAIVIDLLRASTTIVHALAAGAKEVIPCLEVDEAFRRAAEFPPGTAILGGERQGKLIPGFQLDNSPLGYTTQNVTGKSVLFTTTNGTRALHRAARASRILVGALVNLDAIVACVAHDARPVHILCAGTDGQISAEDVFCAGATIQGLMEGGRRDPSHEFSLDCDSARLAVEYWRAGVGHPEGILWSLRESLGGRNLIELGLDADIERAATPNLFAIVPEFLPGEGRIVVRS